MAWMNYHCHSDFCDGIGRPLGYVESALDRGVELLGFSSHAPLPFAAAWCLGRGRWPATLHRYRTEIESLRRVYRGRLSLACGLEVDYIPGLIGPSDRAFSEFDYRIGSVHFVGTTAEGAPWLMDDGAESFEAGMKEQFGGDPRTLVETYYRRLAEMAWIERPDIIGHFDLVKKYNRHSRYFDEGAAWYQGLVEQTLRVVAASGCIVELNTGGMARGWTDEPYPSPWILKRCRELGVPVTLSSDCHETATLDFGYREAAALLLRAGYEELQTLEGAGWRPLRFDSRGLRLHPMRVAA